jgi:hypothetical protein
LWFPGVIFSGIPFSSIQLTPREGVNLPFNVFNYLPSPFPRSLLFMVIVGPRKLLATDHGLLEYAQYSCVVLWLAVRSTKCSVVMTVEAQETKHCRRPEKVVEVNGVDYKKPWCLQGQKGSPDDFIFLPRQKGRGLLHLITHRGALYSGRAHPHARFQVGNLGQQSEQILTGSPGH